MQKTVKICNKYKIGLVVTEVRVSRDNKVIINNKEVIIAENFFLPKI